MRITRSHRPILASLLVTLPVATLLATPATALASTTSAQPAHTVARATAAKHEAAKHGAAKHEAAKRHVVTHKAAKHKVVKHKAVKHAPAAKAPASAAVSAVSLTPFEARMVVLVNQARAAAGVPALTVAAGTTDVARTWALQLAANDGLSHNPAIVSDLEAAGSPDWHFLAENVGTGPIGDADGLFTAYMNSPGHRANILDPHAVEIGMGAVAANEPDGDAEWNVMDFVDSYSASYGGARTHGVSDDLPVAALTSAVLG